MSAIDNLVAHYLDKSAEDTYAYDVKLITSNNNGESWNTAFKPHQDNTNTEHGFVSRVSVDNSSFLTVWLDGREYQYAETDSTKTKQMTLRSALIDKDNNILQKQLIDSRVCDCCQTDLANIKNGQIVVYRDRSNDEIRDIYYSRRIKGAFIYLCF